MGNCKLIFFIAFAYFAIPYYSFADIIGDLGVSSFSREDFIVSMAYDGREYFQNKQYLLGEHVVVWYSPLHASNQTQLLQYAQRTVEIADSVLAIYYGMGYLPPPGDSILSHRFTGGQYYYGVNNSIDIYLMDLSSQRLLGLAQADGETSFENSYGVLQSSAFMILDNSPATASAADIHKITVAHELFHIIQIGYRMFTSQDVFTDYHGFLEVTAVAKEQFIFPHIKSYAVGARAYLENGFFEPIPSVAPRNSGRYDLIDLYYGASLWFVKLLGQTQSADILVNMLETVKRGGSPGFAIENGFATHNLDFNTFWRNFITEIVNLKFGNSSLTDANMLVAPIVHDTLMPMSRFMVESKDYSTTVFFNTGNIDPVFEDMNLENWVIGNVFGTDIWYVYNSSFSGVSQFAAVTNRLISQENNYFVYPNPINLTIHDSLYFSRNFQQDSVDYTIYDISGRRVTGGTIFQGKIDISSLQSSGVYFVVVKKDEEKLVFRFAAMK